MPDEKVKSDRAHMSKVTLAIGPMSQQGNLYTVLKTNAGEEEKTHMTCPDCDSPVEFLQQQYRCQDDDTHGPFLPAECSKGKKVPQADGSEKIVKVDADAIKAAKESLRESGEFDLTVHSRADVEAHTFPRGNCYVFTPTGKGILYGMLVELLKKRTDIALIAKTNMRKTDHLVQVELGMNNQLVIREIVWPEDAKEFAPVQYEKPSAKNMTMAEMLIDSAIEDFDPADYVKEDRARVAEAIEEAASGTPAKKPSKRKVKAEAQDDLTALLTQALEAQQKKKAS
jgi:non-homologous end joining protein Ku